MRTADKHVSSGPNTRKAPEEAKVRYQNLDDDEAHMINLNTDPADDLEDGSVNF